MRISKRFRTNPGGIRPHAEPTNRADPTFREVDGMRSQNINSKMKALWLGLPFLLVLPVRSARAQADILGERSPRVYNDGGDVGDDTGIPLNEAGGLRAESGHPDQIYLPENECRPHPIYIAL